MYDFYFYHHTTYKFFSSAVHADGQYQCSTFQESLFQELGNSTTSDDFFLTPWDVSHWMDLAMADLREDGTPVSSLIKRLIKRANRFMTFTVSINK